MKLIIDIDEEAYKMCKQILYDGDDIERAIANGRLFEETGMDDDLISREALKDEIQKELDKADLSEYEACICVTSIYDRLIDNAKTVCHDNYAMGYQDGVRTVLSERPTGKWIYGNLDHSTCSNCNYANHYGDLPFCPNCGADMRGDKE